MWRPRTRSRSRRSGAGCVGTRSSARGWPGESGRPAAPADDDATGRRMTPALLATLAGLGFVGALLSGLVGVGGAVVTIPLLYYVPPWLGVGILGIKEVSGVTMAQVLA